jgi:DNA-binding transcriptional MerR regulator
LDKAPDAFRTISEVAEELDIPQHVLRFWESRFAQIKPMKRAGGRRYYRPDDVDLLRGIRHLLYGEGYTIRGVQRILKEHGGKFVQRVWQVGAEQPQAVASDFVPEEGAGGAPGEHQVSGETREPPMFPNNERQVHAAPVPSKVSPSPETAAAASLALERAAAFSDERFRRLRDALQELIECRRLLDASMTPAA